MANEIKVGSKVRLNLSHAPELIVNEIQEFASGIVLKCIYWDPGERNFKKLEVAQGAVILLT